jgi:hypothetical protein
MVMSTTFRRWLTEQRDRDDPVGDVARDILADGCASGLSAPRSLRRHMVDAHAPIDPALDAFDRAEAEWRTTRTT